MKPILIVTPGDLDGIGLEITVKALAKKNYSKTSIIVVLVHPSQLASSEFSYLTSLASEVTQLTDISKISPGFYYLVDPDQPPFWVEKFAAWILKQKGNAALVTGPLSKILIQSCGFKQIGHTEILADVCNIPKTSLFMFFIGQLFNVVSLTGHIPISQVENILLTIDINALIVRLLDWLKQTTLHPHPLFVLGLNPHAGESGLIGRYEVDHLIPALEKLSNSQIQGPLIPDAAFNYQNIIKGATYLGLYHDQVLIPFKQAHGFSGVHVTGGLPFLRTSVDHGTAKNIFGQNIADFSSMFDAINLAESWLPFYYYDPSRRG